MNIIAREAKGYEKIKFKVNVIGKKFKQSPKIFYKANEILKNVYETSESIIHHLNISATFWGEKPKEQELNSGELDSLGT